METSYKEFNSGCKSFYYDDNIIHVIPTSNPHGNDENYYIVVFDDPYFLDTGRTEILTKSKIESKYNIKLQ